jgi:O-acetyl-ADP-ribose deacetylase (regulator of RNase III)
MSDAIRQFLSGRVLCKVGDITQQSLDAIVNAANSSLMGGGGVDGAIHRAGGPAIKAECAEIRRTRYPGGLPTGQAVITSGGNLPSKHVIHTVGPIYGSGGADKADLLAACYVNSLRLATEHQLATIAFPAISTGIYGYPQDQAARVASRAIEGFLTADKSIVEVRLVFFASADAGVFLQHQAFSS